MFPLVVCGFVVVWSLYVRGLVADGEVSLGLRLFVVVMVGH